MVRNWGIEALHPKDSNEQERGLKEMTATKELSQ